MGKKAPRAPSIVASFSPQPWLESAGDSVAPDACHLALGAVRMPLVAMREDGQNDSSRATTPGELTDVGTAAPSPRCGEPAQLRHGGLSNSPAQ
jgi:hypothetical protein